MTPSGRRIRKNRKNPWALRNIVERLMEAVQRGLWEQPDEAQLAQMRQVYLQLEGEGWIPPSPARP